MKVAEFKELIEKIQKYFEKDLKNTFSHAGLYIFHDKYADERGRKQGISFNINNSALDLQVFTLENLVESENISRYTDSKVLQQSYYLLTAKQHLELLKLIRSKTNLIEY